MNIIEINKKREKLNEAKKYLKNKFIGLDDRIDEIVSNIEAWYLMPEMINRPIIINLWGLTGVGKTDLVRKLVKFLDFSDKYLEIQMDTKVDYRKSIKSILLDSNLEEGQPGIILLDELQRFRSIDDQGHEILDKDFQDVWMLLSDGKFNGNHAKSDIIEEILDIMYSKESVRVQKQQEIEAKKEAKKEGKNKEVEPIKEIKRKFNISSWRAVRLKKLARLKESIEEIMQWTEDDIYNNLMGKLKTSSNADFEVDYSKCLIFVSGNIDEAYEMSDMVNDADICADTLYNHSKKINVIDIKKALKKRFKPEQIARLGNTHILYLSLSSQNYYDLIHQCIRETLAFAEKMLGNSKIYYDNNVVEFIYRNGVFPAQGVRPVFSTINSIFNNTIPKIILFAKENNLKDIKLKIGDKSNLIIEGVEGFSISLDGSIDKIKRDIDPDNKTLISVHEAGHAIIHSYLFGVCPQEVKSSISSWDGGYILPNKHGGSYLQILDEVTVLLAGQVAEKIVFGDSYQSTGASSDISKATIKIMKFLRNQGLGDKISYVLSINHMDSSSYNTDLSYSNEQSEIILQEQKKRAIQILLDNKSFFKIICTKLIENGKIEPLEFKEIAGNFGLNLKIESAEKHLYLDYSNKWNKFFNEIK